MKNSKILFVKTIHLSSKVEIKLERVSGDPLLFQIVSTYPNGLSILECKRLVEAIMRLGVREYTKNCSQFVEFCGDPFQDE